MLAFLLAVSDGKHNAEIVELYNKYSADMLVLAKSYLKRKNQFDYEVAAEDAVQNAFLKIIRYSHKIRFDEPEKMVRAYVYAVLINECKLLIKENPWCTICVRIFFKMFVCQLKNFFVMSFFIL